MAPLPLLVTSTEALEWGFDTTTAALRRASARVRGYLNQQITAGTSTITARGPVFRLPQRPVVEVSSVVDSKGLPVTYELSGSLLTVDSIDTVTVSYSHGFTELPEPLIELVCQIAVRLGAAPATPLTEGVQTHSAGSFSVTYGAQAFEAASGLTRGEEKALNRYWPRLPGIITMGSAAS